MTPPDEVLTTTLRLLAARIERHRDELNRLNVYPVPDADTGDNLADLLRAVTDLLPECGVVDAVSSGALHGGRGSSGVIFGQALHGFVTAYPAGPAAALTAAATAARIAVADPVEGTILTVADEAARATNAAALAGNPVAELVAAAAAAGRRALARTPELLPALGAAGVVDAGGFGYVLFLDSLTEAVIGVAEPPPELRAPQRSIGEASSGGRFEVTCLLAAGANEVDALRRRWLALGDTVAIAGVDHTWRCHVHTDDVAAALAAVRDAGGVSDLQITGLP